MQEVVVAAGKEEKIKKKKKQNGDGEIGTGGFQTAAVAKLRPPPGEEPIGERERL